MKQYNIALFGAYINSTNLGCQALTYSLISTLENVSKSLEIELIYNIFEYKPDKIKTKEMCMKLDVDETRVHTYRFVPLYRLGSYRYILSNMRMLNRIRECGLAIDITAGDSFSDIYGKERFISTSRIKKLIEFMGIPLILGPQTYGPYYNNNNQNYAKKIFEKSYMIIARDKISAQLVSTLTGHKIQYTTDLAFQLPYLKRTRSDKKINVGINISGLLVGERTEKGIERPLVLETDYDMYICDVLNYLLCDDVYEVTLVSHVDEDMKACEKIHKKFPSTKIAPLFDNPIDIKSYISGFDIFIGARMHATIASFTSGVVTIPTAYSRKFSGLFDVINYKRIIDLQILSTEEAVERTIGFISNYIEISKEVQMALSVCDEYNNITNAFFSEALSVLKK